ncbi:MAG: hypothetical protein ABIY47_06435 [Opitutaceae bacterium]
MTLLAGAGSLRWDDIRRCGAWDFIDCPTDFRAYPHMPNIYKGMSGGGIWAVLIAKEHGAFVIRNFALVGVTFYQSRERSKRDYLRGHFVRSIYGRAWRKFPMPAAA